VDHVQHLAVSAVVTQSGETWIEPQFPHELLLLLQDLAMQAIIPLEPVVERQRNMQAARR
jgi:hypothetical protein